MIVFSDCHLRQELFMFLLTVHFITLIISTLFQGVLKW